MGIQCPFDNINTRSQLQKKHTITFSVLTEQMRTHVSIVWSKSKNLRHRQLSLFFLVFTHPSLGVPKDDCFSEGS